MVGRTQGQCLSEWLAVARRTLSPSRVQSPYPLDSPGTWTEGSNTPWNSRIRSSSASTVEAISCLPQANSFSFTTSSLRTSPNVARPARQSGPRTWVRRLPATTLPRWKPARTARDVGRKPLSRSSRPKADRYFAGNVSSSDAQRQPRPDRRPRDSRISRLVLRERRHCALAAGERAAARLRGDRPVFFARIIEMWGRTS